MKKIAISLLIFIVIVFLLCLSVFAQEYTINLPENYQLQECNYYDNFNGYIFGTNIECKGTLDGQTYTYTNIIYPTQVPFSINVTDGLNYSIKTINYENNKSKI